MSPTYRPTMRNWPRSLANVMSDSRLELIPEGQGPYFWPMIEPWMKEACDEGDGFWSSEAIKEAVECGDMAVWMLWNGEQPTAAMVTEVQDWENRRVAILTAAGGSVGMDAIASEFHKVIAWARFVGAREIIIRGRRGWSRAMKTLGFEEIAVTLRKVL